MAVGYETNTTLETIPQALVIAIGNDRDSVTGNQAWYDYELSITEDMAEFYLTATQHYNGVHRKARETNDYSDSALFKPITFEYGRYFEPALLHQFQDTSLQPLIQRFGLVTETKELDENGSRRVDLTSPLPHTLADNVDALQLPAEHTILKPVLYSGAIFKDREFFAALRRNEFLVSNDPNQAVHDISFHYLAWALLPPEIIQKIAAVGEQLAIEADDPDLSKKATWDAKKALTDYMGSALDGGMSIYRYARVIVDVLDDRHHERQLLTPKQELKHLLGTFVGESEDLDTMTEQTIAHARFVVDQASQLAQAA